MDALFGAVPWETIGAGGLVTMIGLLIGTGRWVPASTVREIKELRDERIRELVEERADLRAARDANEETLRELIAQNRQLMELAETGNALMRALTSATGRETS